MSTSKTPPHSKKRQRSDGLVLHRHWLAYAEKVASRPISEGGSPHPTTKIGAVLVDPKGKVLASSSNRFAHGVDRRRPERFANGKKSLWLNCAEQLAISTALQKRVSIKGAKLYVTLEPCAICAGMIAELGIRRVFVPVGAMRRYAKLKAKWKSSIEIGLIKLAEAGTILTAIDTRKDDLKKKSARARSS